MKTYLLNLLVAFDYAVNSLLAGLPYETLSSRAYRMQQKPQPYWRGLAACIDFIFFWQERHCSRAYRQERAVNRLPNTDETSEALQ
jgi:hypothetical protein